MKKSQLAVNTVSTRGDFEATLAAYAAAGFTQVEWVIPQVKGWLNAGHNLDDLKTLLARLGLRSIGGFETTVCCFGDASAQAQNHDLLVANAALLDALGGGVMVCGTDGPAEHPDVQALQAAGRVCARLVQRFPASVSLAIEFNWSPLVKSLKAADVLAVAAADPRVGILFDTAHYHCTPTKLEDLTPDRVSRILHVHINDMRDVPGDRAHCNADRVLPGQGILPIAAILQRLEAGGYTGPIAIEMFNQQLWDTPVTEAARQMYASLLPYCR